MFLDEFENDQFTLFGNVSGISISTDKRRLITFFKADGAWLHKSISWDEIRSVVKETLTPNEFIHMGGGGARGIGEGIGTAIRNSVEKSKAKKASGIALELKSIDTPRLFLSFPEESDRNRVFEAVRQFLEGDLSGTYQKIPTSVAKNLRRPTTEEVAAAERAAANKRAFVRGAIKVVGVISVVGAVVFFGGREFLKSRYTSSLDTPARIENSSGLSCTLYYLGYDAIRLSQSGYVSHWVSRDVEISAPATETRRGDFKPHRRRLPFWLPIAPQKTQQAASARFCGLCGCVLVGYEQCLGLLLPFVSLIFEIGNCTVSILKKLFQELNFGL